MQDEKREYSSFPFVSLIVFPCDGLNLYFSIFVFIDSSTILLWNMEDNNSTNPPLLLRLSTPPRMEEKPPKLLSRLSTQPHRKRKRESSSESSKEWKFSERESVHDSKRRHASPKNWKDGKDRQIRRKERHLTHTSRKSTPSLLSRMRPDPQPEEPLPLWERLSSPGDNQLPSESERKLKNSWTRCPEETSTENPRRMSSESYGKEPERKTCLGITPPPTYYDEAAVSRPVESCSNSERTSQESNLSCRSPASRLQPPRGNPVPTVGPNPSR